MNKLFSIAVFPLGSLALAACGTDSTTQVNNTPPPQTPPPVETSKAELGAKAFWDAFYAGNWDELPNARSLLEQAYAEDPLDPHNTFLLAHAHFWALGEAERDQNVDPDEQNVHAMNALRYFSEAAELNPEDARIPGWVAALTMGAAADLAESPDPAQQMQAERMQQEAMQTLMQGAQVYPEFFTFLTGIVLENAPAGSPPFELAVESYWRGYEACFDEPVDRSAPDMTRFMSRATNEGPKKICWSGGLAPHGFEGMALRVGDVLVKAGELDAARTMYHNAKLSPTFSTWRFKDEIDARINSDLQLRTALYRDEDPRNDPPIGRSPEGCISCHGK